MTAFSDPIPADDPARRLRVVRPDTDESLAHLAVVGDTYTVVLSGEDTDGKYVLMDMLIPTAESGPPPHRHDYEEMYYLLEGRIELTVRDETVVLGVGEVASIPANAPHTFRSCGDGPARFLCMTTTTGLEDFFNDIGTLVATRTTPAPAMSEAGLGEFMRKAMSSAPRHGMELLPPVPGRAANGGRSGG